MAVIICDFTEAKEFDRTVIPDGIYRATIDARYAKDVKYGRDKGTPYISLGFVISEPEEYAGRVVFNNYMLSGPGSGNLRGLFRTLGLYDDSMGKQFQINTNTLQGYEVVIRVKTRALKDGTEVNDVLEVLRADH